MTAWLRADPNDHVATPADIIFQAHNDEFGYYEFKTSDHLIFDNDGVGSFVDGFIEGAQEFNNGGRPVNGENYNHLKSQCFYKSGESGPSVLLAICGP